MLKAQIDNDLKAAMVSKDTLTLETLRMLKSRVKNEEISKGKELSDEDFITVLLSEVKRRRDSVEQYTSGGRMDLADKESAEIKVLQKYLPQQMSEEEVRGVVKEVLAEQNFTAADFGKAMGAMMSRLKGKADGSVISKILKEELK